MASQELKVILTRRGAPKRQGGVRTLFGAGREYTPPNPPRFRKKIFPESGKAGEALKHFSYA